MAVARTNIINFFSEEDFDKYFVLHKEFVKTLDDCGLLEATYVRASPTSLLYFSLVKTEGGAGEILRRANKWRKKYDFKVEVITFDGEVLYEYGKVRTSS